MLTSVRVNFRRHFPAPTRIPQSIPALLVTASSAEHRHHELSGASSSGPSERGGSG